MKIPGFPPKFNGISLAIAFANIATEHGPKLLHMNNIDLLTRDLGNALVKQQFALKDPSKGHIMTAYEVVPLIAEVKLLTSAVSSKLGIDTTNKTPIAVLEEIVAKTEERGSQAAEGVKTTLGWTRGFFSHPEIQEVLRSDVTEIQLPKSMHPKDIFNSVKDTVVRGAQEVSRLNDFLSKAKTLSVVAENEVKPQPAVEDTLAKKDEKPKDPPAPKVA